MRRALAISAGVLALVLGVYAAAGYWLAPQLVRDTLTEQAARRGIQLRIETVRTDPFMLRVAVEGVSLRASGQDQFAAARRASIDLAWASLWEWQWVLDEIRLEAPWVDVEQLPAMDGRAGDGEAPAILIRQVTVVDGTAPLGVYGLTLQGLNAKAQDLSTQSREGGHYAIDARIEGGGQISSSGSVTLVPLSAQGNIEASAIPISIVWQPVQGTIHATAQYAYKDGRLVLREAAVDGSAIGYAATTVSHLQVTASDLAVPSEAPFELTAKVSVAPEGSFTAQGKVSLRPLQANLQIEAANLPLTDLQQWLPEHIDAKLVSGSLSGKGSLNFARNEAQPTVRYEGAAAVSNLRVEEGDSGRLLIAWNLAESTLLRAESQPPRVTADEIIVREPEGRLIIEKDGSVNFVTAFAGGKTADETGGPLQIMIDRTRLENGSLQFADRSLDNPFEVVMRELAGSIVGFSTEGGDPARVELAGRVERYGSARVQGTINLDAPTSLAQFVADFRNLPLATFNPYVVRFAGYRIESGRLSAELRYQVRDGRLEGKNQLVFEQIQLGEKVEGSKLDLPLELAVALLADRHGRIDLDIPVSGNLQNPQFDFGAIIAQAFGNVVRSIVTAPFRALSSLLGGGRDRTPGEVHFDPGAVALAPPEEEDVARLAKALGERPQLRVVVRGSYDIERDLAALRERAVRREILMRAGAEPGDGGEGIDFRDPQLLQAAERMYLERVGNRLELQRLRARESRYGRALVEKLANTIKVDEAELQNLARARAEVVRAALLTQGVEAARVGVAPPVEQARESNGVPTTLKLTAG